MKFCETLSNFQIVQIRSVQLVKEYEGISNTLKHHFITGNDESITALDSNFPNKY